MSDTDSTSTVSAVEGEFGGGSRGMHGDVPAAVVAGGDLAPATATAVGGRRMRQSRKRQGGSWTKRRRGATRKRSGGSRKRGGGSRKKR
jgi:hypothetical protein